MVSTGAQNHRPRTARRHCKQAMRAVCASRLSSADTLPVARWHQKDLKHGPEERVERRKHYGSAALVLSLQPHVSSSEKLVLVPRRLSQTETPCVRMLHKVHTFWLDSASKPITVSPIPIVELWPLGCTRKPRRLS